MKTLFLLLALLISNEQVFSQSTIAFLGAPGAGNPAGSGPSVAAQVVTFYTNPTTAFSPALTATFSLSNQQFTSIEGNPGSAGAQFGGTSNTANSPVGSISIYPLMNSISGSVNSNYTACNSCAPSTGISTSANRSIELYHFSDALIDASGNQLYALNAKVQYADLTITFSAPVNNPVLQITGLGGDVFDSIAGPGGNTNYTQGFSTEFDLLTPGLSLSKLSGNAALVVSPTQITNGAAHFSFSTTPAPEFGVIRSAATGSVVVQGTNISTFTLRMFLHGDGGTITNNAGVTVPATNGNIVRWAFHGSFSSSGSKVNGDGFLLGLSLEEPGTILPVSITSFVVTADEHKTLLRWQTVFEKNNRGFEIERSPDGKTWTQAGFTDSKANQGNSEMKLDYLFPDNSPFNGLNYYRLKQIDFDNKFQYSAVRTIVFSGNNKTVVYPNPVKDQLNIMIPDRWINCAITIEITKATGQLVYRKHFEYAEKHVRLSVRDLSAGMYFLKLQQSAEHIAFAKIQIIQ